MIYLYDPEITRKDISNVNKAFAHVLLNKNNFAKISCKTCFDADIPKDFLEYVYSTLSEYSLVNSLR